MRASEKEHSIQEKHSKPSPGRVEWDMPMGQPKSSSQNWSRPPRRHQARPDSLQRHLDSRAADKASQMDKERGRREVGGGCVAASVPCEGQKRNHEDGA